MKKALLPLAALALIALLPRTAAGTSLAVYNTPVWQDVVPGQTYTQAVQIGNADEPCTVTVSVLGFGQSLDGGFYALEPDTNPFTAKPFVSVNPAVFALAPGEWKAVTVTIAAPTDLGPGSRYAMLGFSPDSSGPGSGNVGLGVAIMVPVVVGNSAAPYAQAGTITAADLGPVSRSQDLVVTTTFRNGGNTHFRAMNRTQVLGAGGATVTSVTGTATVLSILPSYSFRFRQTAITVSQLQNLPGGDYRLRDEVLLENGTVLDGVELSFTLSELPPPPGCPDWDVLCDHVVSLPDIGKITGNMGKTGTPGWIRADVNRDGKIDRSDIDLVIAHWGETW